jgi:hypothetical protein
VCSFSCAAPGAPTIIDSGNRAQCEIRNGDCVTKDEIGAGGEAGSAAFSEILCIPREPPTP